MSSLITALEGLPTQLKNQMKVSFFEIETVVKIKLCGILVQLNQRHEQAEKLMDFVEEFAVASEEQCISTQFQQMQKKLN